MISQAAGGLPANYITNMSLLSTSGGWNGMNAALYAGLSNRFQFNYVGPIDPPASRFQRVWSKVKQFLRRHQAFYFFSERRLNSIAKTVSQKSAQRAIFDYYHGITPWIACPQLRPAFAYTDACFLTYYDTYHQKDYCSPSDLQRIAWQEKCWLQRLTHVYFSSQYALDECCRRYELPGSNFECAGLGASIEVPASDQYAGGTKLLFVAVDFERKGGNVCVEAFKQFRHQVPAATLTLVGAAPPAHVLDIPGVSWAGFLSKEVPEQLRQLKAHLASAFALVLPTVSDMTPLVVAEAALHGCPTLAPRAFGLPEMIDDRITGRLLSAPPRAEQFSQALVELAQNPQDYLHMRRCVREAALQKFTWSQVADRIASSIIWHLDNVAS